MTVIAAPCLCKWCGITNAPHPLNESVRTFRTTSRCNRCVKQVERSACKACGGPFYRVGVAPRFKTGCLVC